jgi:hypothetical protein
MAVSQITQEAAWNVVIGWRDFRVCWLPRQGLHQRLRSPAAPGW